MIQEVNASMNVDKYKRGIELMQSGACKDFPDYIVNERGCWISKLKQSPTGYVLISRNDGDKQLNMRLHVLSYFIKNGFDGAHEKSHICHKKVCNGMAGCFNPDHVYLGDSFTNQLDRLEYGVHNRGEAGVNAKLTDEEVIKIKSDLRNGHKGSDLARDHGVSRMAISFIKNGKTWRHIK